MYNAASKFQSLKSSFHWVHNFSIYLCTKITSDDAPADDDEGGKHTDACDEDDDGGDNDTAAANEDWRVQW